MNAEYPDDNALVYEQDEAFVTAVGEPIPLDEVTRVVVATVDLLYADALCRVVVVSGRKDEHSLQALRAARFDGFFDPLEEKLEALFGALRQVAEGRGYLSPSLGRRMFAQRSAGVLVPRLTPAELQVFAVIGDGSDDGEAAVVLGLSGSTVATHRRNIMRKLEVSSSAKLVREAVRLGVVRISPDGEVTRPGFDSSLGGRRARPG